jgi:hypothetical protein
VVERLGALWALFIASGSRARVSLPRVQPIDTAPLTAKDHTMNTSTTFHRAVSFSFAVLVTVMTLAGVDSLAKQETSAAQMARAAVSAQA